MRLLTTKTPKPTSCHVQAGWLRYTGCKSFDPAKVSDYKYAQIKRDGMRVFVVGDTVRPYVFTTQGLDIYESIESLVCIPYIPPGAIVECELEAQSGIRSDVKAAIASEEPLCLFAFATNLERSDYPAPQTSNTLRSIGFRVPHTYESHEVDLTEHNGYEGFIFKSCNYHGGWMKFKWESTIDLVVTGTSYGTGANTGRTGILHLSTSDGTEIASVKVLDEQHRDEIDSLGEAVIGRVCEVKYQHVGSRGRLIHPRFLKWRPDKQEGDCPLSQDKRLFDIYKA